MKEIQHSSSAGIIIMNGKWSFTMLRSTEVSIQLFSAHSTLKCAYSCHYCKAIPHRPVYQRLRTSFRYSPRLCSQADLKTPQFYSILWRESQGYEQRYGCCTSHRNHKVNSKVPPARSQLSTNGNGQAYT